MQREEGSPWHGLSGSSRTTSSMSVEREKHSLTMSSMMLCFRYIHVFTSFQSLQTLIRVKSSHHSVPLIFSFPFTGNQADLTSAPSCRRWGVSASMKDGPFSITPWLVLTCPTSRTCAPSCLGKLRRMNWCLASSILLPPRNSMLRWKRKRPRLVRLLG